MLLKAIFIGVFVLSLTSSPLAQGIQKGLWEISSETVVEGMPMKLPPMTTQSCITSERYIPDNPEKNTNCKMLYNKQQGNTITWKAVCKEKGSTIETTGKMTYIGKSFESEVQTIVNEGGERVNSTIRSKGRYLGPCK